jgi:hypothetical protein
MSATTVLEGAGETSVAVPVLYQMMLREGSAWAAPEGSVSPAAATTTTTDRILTTGKWPLHERRVEETPDQSVARRFSPSGPR